MLAVVVVVATMFPPPDPVVLGAEARAQTITQHLRLLALQIQAAAGAVPVTSFQILLTAQQEAPAS